MTQLNSTGVDKLQQIDAYAAAGFRLTPIRTQDPHRGKAPLETNWTDTPFEPIPDHKTYQKCNFGVVLDDDHLVVDIDPRNYPDGRKVWTELSSVIGLAPEDLKMTFIVQTGGGGKHIYFKKPAHIQTRHTLHEYPGIEFKTKGRQVIGAGCIHPETGKQYVPLTNTPGDIKDIPTALLALITQDLTLTATAMTIYDATNTDTPQAVDRFIEYLRTLATVKTGTRNNACYIAACRGKEFGLSPETTIKFISTGMPLEEALSPGELDAVVRSAFIHSRSVAGSENAQAVFKKLPKKPSGSYLWDLDNKKKAKPTLGNLTELLSLDEMGLTGLLAFNKLRSEIETTRPVPWPPYKQKVWDSSDTIHLKHYISRVQKMEYSVSVVDEGVLAVAMHQGFHPVLDWLMPISWDGKPRLDTWLTRICGVKDTPYTRAAAAITIMASVKRMIHPGCKFDYMLILEGKQGSLKSSVIKTLAGNNPQLYSETGLNLAGLSAEKDTVAIISNKMFVEIAELVMNTKGEAEQVKAFLTRQYDEVRMPYQKYTKSIPRQCVFIGTTNPERGAGYFRDNTGNRRFWPVECSGNIDLLTLELERDQLFAEALVRVNKGEKLYMDKAIEDLAEGEQEERVMVDPWQDLLEQEVTQNRVWLTEELYCGILKCDPKNLGQREQRRISACMRNIGFEYGKYFHATSGKRRRGFKHPGYDIAEEYDKLLEIEQNILDIKGH